MKGIYIIACLVTGVVYVGSSASIRRRWKDHSRSLERGTHFNPLLQNAWNKYGADAFSWSVLRAMSTATTDELLEAEREAIEAMGDVYQLESQPVPSADGREDGERGDAGEDTRSEDGECSVEQGRAANRS